jgi:tryptophan-rich sensory protein
MPRLVSLALFLLLVLGGGLLIGINNIPGPWYEALRKPWFNPPNWLFGPAWTTLYVLIAIAGWRVWQRERSGRLMWLWWLQLALNFLWSPVFFGAQQPGAALAVIVVLLATILAFIGIAWNRDRPAALLFLPYAAWVVFATLLNGSIFFLN